MSVAILWRLLVCLLIMSLGIGLYTLAEKRLRSVPEDELPAALRKRPGILAIMAFPALLIGVMGILNAIAPGWPWWLRMIVGVLAFSLLCEPVRRIVATRSNHK